MHEKQTSRIIEYLVWGGMAAVILAIVTLFVLEKFAGKPLPVQRDIPPFSFVNQLGGTVSLDDLRGQVWIANLIFTRCPGPCVKMTKQFSALQSAFPTNAPLKFISLTADPEFDTPEVLKRFAEKHGAVHERWSFLTGSKRELYELAMNGLLLALQEKSPEERTFDEDLFIHSTFFVLVDKHGRMRAYYESEDPEALKRIVKDANKLLREK